MKKGLFTCFGVLVAGFASALSVQWNWDSYGNIDPSTTDTSFYLVYSETALSGSTNQEIAATAANAALNGGAGTTIVHPGSWSATTSVGGTENWTNSNRVSFNDWSGALGTGYYYLVVFNSKPDGTADADYSVALAGSVSGSGVTATVGADGKVTITGTSVGPDDSPSGILFADPTWISWGYRDAAPEPTALALLALGAAGLALRRKVA